MSGFPIFMLAAPDNKFVKMLDEHVYHQTNNPSTNMGNDLFVFLLPGPHLTQAVL